MNLSASWRTGLLVALALFTTLLLGFSFWPQPEEEIDFNTHIRPILNGNCLSCHGGVKRNGDLNLMTRAAAMTPGKSGKPAIVPGEPENSELLRRVQHHDLEVRMPPDGQGLDGEQIELLTRWIKAGAEWADHWAYLSPDSTIEPPKADNWANNGIDAFVRKAQQATGLSPNPEADRPTLLRRVSLDLTGLPPTPAEVQHFVQNAAPDAYEQEVDRLLASPHFGEKWAAMWLDLARYGDSQGYQKDPHRNIWRYRDWVIEAFNRDLPFDQFTIEQLAGDLLPEPDDQQLLATAFHRNTMSNTEGGTDDEEFRVAAVIDRVNTTFEIWQGVTMGCVQCHSHPYDPFPHEEFYETYAFFNNTADADRNDDWPVVPLFSSPQQTEVQQLVEWIAQNDPEAPLSEAQDLEANRTAALADLHLAADCDPCANVRSRSTEGGEYLRRFSTGSVAVYPGLSGEEIDSISVQYLGGSPESQIEVRLDHASGPLLGRLSLPPTGVWFGQSMTSWKEAGSRLKPFSGKRKLVLVGKGAEKGAIADLLSFHLHSAKESAIDQQLLAKRRQLLLLEAGRTPVMQELDSAEARVTHLFERGNWLVHGPVVQPDVPQVLNDFPDDAPRNRLGFAQWLTHPDNPLTARVMVNRFWEQIFGQGLVETVEDFGTQGEKPTHPELLDWLALEFVHTHQWSTKRLLKQMVLSATYRQSSAVSPRKHAQDPANRWLARGSRIRLSAEQIRDQALAVSGLLNPKVYGPSVMPPQPEGVWQVIRQVMRWKSAQDKDRYRRAIYTYWRKSSPYPAMMTFDTPSRELCVSRRIRTNTPLQALATLNDTTFQEASIALAQRMLREGGSTIDSQLAYGYQLALQKELPAKKQTALLGFYQQSLNNYQADSEAVAALLAQQETPTAEWAALTQVALVFLNLDEFINKE